MSDANRIHAILASLDALLEREQRVERAAVSSLLETIQTLQGGSADRRYVQLSAQLKQLRERLDLLAQMVRDDYLAKIGAEARRLGAQRTGERAVALLDAIAGARPGSLTTFCETLLDRLIEATGARRGFVLFYVPESTEADVVAARNFLTRNLSLEEYAFSRTVLRRVFERGTRVLLDDASSDPAYAHETSVHRFALRSVLAVPFSREGRTIGAVYLENGEAVSAFGPASAELVTIAAWFAAHHLSASRLLPPVSEREGRVYLDASRAASEIVGSDPAIVDVLRTIDRIADSPAPVLVEGESGTGKELVARALHYRGARRDRPFVAINCAAIPEQLMESELFGHERGAFTGAVERAIGRFEQANGGTIFLDEISELAYPLQAKLLRFLQSHEMQRLGGRETIRVDVRLVAATSKDLRTLMRDGTFQEALFFRIHVVPIALPPLRERGGDVPVLAAHFLEKYAALYGRRMRIDADAMACLGRYSFPGNVRELENVVHRLVVLAPDETVRVGDLPPEVLAERVQRVSLAPDPLAALFADTPADFEELRRRRDLARREFQALERRLAEQAIRDAGGNVTEAAARLGVHRVTLHKLVRRGVRGEEPPPEL